MDLLEYIIGKVISWVDRVFHVGERVVDRADDYTPLFVYALLMLAGAKLLASLGKVISVKKTT